MAPKQKPGCSEQSVQTPSDFLRAVEKRFGRLVFDLAASEQNTVVPGCFYNEAQNALTRSWVHPTDQSNVVVPVGRAYRWLNPPFARPVPWLAKATEENANTLVLLPCSGGANWWRDWVHEKVPVLQLNGRLKFVGHTDFYPKDLALFIFGDPDRAEECGVVKWYHVWDWRKDALI